MENEQAGKSVIDDQVETHLWIGFARQFFSGESYRYGAAVAWILGAEGTAAAIQSLKRTEASVSGRDSLACNEAAAILTGALGE